MKKHPTKKKTIEYDNLRVEEISDVHKKCVRRQAHLIFDYIIRGATCFGYSQGSSPGNKYNT